MIEKAYSDSFLAANCTPTTFSTALPAMATITRPANACEMCSESIAGSNAATNQSDTNAADPPAMASMPIARPTGQRGGSLCACGTGSLVVVLSRLSEYGSDSPNSTSRTTETIIENDTSCSEAGACTSCAIDGIAMAVTDRTISTRMVRTWAEPSFCDPCLSPPTRNANPSTSSRLARMEPISAARTTSTSPALSAKMQMNSSGRLPSADCSTPVAPGPNRSPSCSTARPTSEASTVTARALTTKPTRCGQPP